MYNDKKNENEPSKIKKKRINFINRTGHTLFHNTL